MEACLTLLFCAIFYVDGSPKFALLRCDGSAPIMPHTALVIHESHSPVPYGLPRRICAYYTCIEGFMRIFDASSERMRTSFSKNGKCGRVGFLGVLQVVLLKCREFLYWLDIHISPFACSMLAMLCFGQDASSWHTQAFYLCLPRTLFISARYPIYLRNAHVVVVNLFD